MKNLFIATTAILISLALYSFARTENSSVESDSQKKGKVNQKKESKALMEVDRQWGKAASPEEFFGFIGEDVLVLAPGKSLASGHAEMGEVLAEFQALPGFEIKWEPQEAFVSEAGDLGYTVDRILVNYTGDDGNKVNLYEKGITIWKKDSEDNWKLAVDIWNTDPTINSIFQ